MVIDLVRSVGSANVCFRLMNGHVLQTSVDLFVKKCRVDIQKLNFNKSLKFSNLSKEEWTAHQNLKTRDDIVIKPVDKGGAVVVWRTDLYKQEAFRQLADAKFYAKVNKDLTQANQKIVKDTVNKLILEQKLPSTSVYFLDINISVQDNKLASSVHCKPTDSHSYLLYSSSHPSHVKDSIPYSQFLRLRRLCSKESDFNSKCDEMSNFFSERGYPDSILSKALDRVQNVN